MKKALFFATAVWLGSTLLPAQVQAAGFCPQVYLPVCAVKKDGTRQTYTNAACARVDRARVLHKDPCYGPICIFLFDPTCARDPRTGRPKIYPSACAAENANATVLNPNACPVKPKI